MSLSVGGPGSDAGPGSAATDAIEADRPVSEVHRAIVDRLDIGAILDGIDGDDRHDRRRILDDAGVDALGGRVADVLATYGAARRADHGAVPVQAHRDAIDVLDALGTGHVDGQPSGLDDLHRALPPCIAASDRSPTIPIRLGVDWAGRRRDDRSRLLQLVADMAVGADVDLRLTRSAAYRILEEHRADVPTWVLTQCRDRYPESSAHASGRGEEPVASALDALDPDGRPAAILWHLRRSPSHALTYDDLASAMALDSPPYESVRRLDNSGLVERLDRADGATIVSLCPLGPDMDDPFRCDYGPLSARSSPIEGLGWGILGPDLTALTPPPNLSRHAVLPPRRERHHPNRLTVERTGADPPEKLTTRLEMVAPQHITKVS